MSFSFTDITKENLLEVYNYIPEDKAVNRKMIRMLERKLETAIWTKHNQSSNAGDELIAEFDKLFDYDIKYSVETEFRVAGQTEVETECDSLEEALGFISGDLDVEEPDADECCDLWIDDSYSASHNLQVSVDNLRLKEDSDAALVELLRKAIASTGIDAEVVPQLMERVYRDGFQLAGASVN